MGVVTTGDLAKVLWPGINATYGQEYKRHPELFKMIYEKFSSRRAFEEDLGITTLGMAQVIAEGSGVPYGSFSQSYVHRYTHVEYGLGFIITRNMIDDDLADVVSVARSKQLAFSIRRTKETVAANVINRAFSGSYLGPDGVSLCSTAHVFYNGGTWANQLAVAADMTEASLEQMCIDVANLTDDSGGKVALTTQKLLIPPALEFEATRILKSVLQNDTANNALNAIRVLGKFPGGIVVNPYLTDTDAYFVLTDCPNGLKYFERRADEFAEDNDFDTSNLKCKATVRCSFGVTDRMSIFGCPGA